MTIGSISALLRPPTQPVRPADVREAIAGGFGDLMLAKLETSVGGIVATPPVAVPLASDLPEPAPIASLAPPAQPLALRPSGAPWLLRRAVPAPVEPPPGGPLAEKAHGPDVTDDEAPIPGTTDVAASLAIAMPPPADAAPVPGPPLGEIAVPRPVLPRLDSATATGAPSVDVTATTDMIFPARAPDAALPTIAAHASRPGSVIDATRFAEAPFAALAGLAPRGDPAATGIDTPAPAPVPTRSETAPPFGLPAAAEASAESGGPASLVLPTPGAPMANGAVPLALATPVPDAVTRQLDVARDEAWLGTLARDIAATSESGGRLRFVLLPEALGRLEIDMQRGTTGLSVQVSTDTEAGRDILASAQPRLVEDIRAQGVRLAGFDIGTAPSGDHADRAGTAPRPLPPQIEAVATLASDAAPPVSKPATDGRYA